MSENYLLEMKDIIKEFSGVRVLKGVQLQVGHSEVHALMGENGAGKSTIMNCLMGIIKPTQGQILFEGKEIKDYTIREAMDFGIAMIHQELTPIPDRTIMSNVWVGREPRTSLGFLDWNKMYEETKKCLAQIGMDEDPRMLMKDLTVAKIQMVEIAKAVYCDAKLIIMDEPTSALTNKEIEDLFDIIRKLKADGRSIIYISHKLDEIYAITDRITVFRDGEYIGSEETAKLEQDKLIQMMVGREVKDLYPKVAVTIGEERFKVEGLSSYKKFQDVSFGVRAGEIFGIAGLVGAGRTELLETIFGVRAKEKGKVILDGKELIIKDSRAAIDAGLAFLTEDRRKDGIFAVLDLTFNSTIANIASYKKSGFLDHKKMKEDCDSFIQSLAIKTTGREQKIMNLSGGNQQKVLVARWLLTEADVILMDEPTRGIDVGAKADIYRLMSELAAKGKMVIMVSSELPELMGMCDRILVMREGRMTGLLENNEEVTQEMLMQHAIGKINDFA